MPMGTQAPPQPDDLLTIAEVSAALRVSYSTLYRWEAAGRIQVERTPTGQRRYRRSEVDAAIQPNRVAS
jgi:excisionase family DNA binding protein